MYQMTDPQLLPNDQVFTHIDPETQEVRHFAVGIIQRWLKSATFIPTMMVNVDVNFARFIIKSRGIERPRIENMTPQERDEPIIMCAMDDGTVLIIDGHHRYVRRVMDGYMDIEGYLLSRVEWEKHLIDIPMTADLAHQLITAIENHTKEKPCSN